MYSSLDLLFVLDLRNEYLSRQEVPSPFRRGLGRGLCKKPPHPSLLPEGEGTSYMNQPKAFSAASTV